MRIIQFTDCYFPTINGVCTSISILVHKLAKSGHEVLVVVPQAIGVDKAKVCDNSDFPGSIQETQGRARSGCLTFIRMFSITMPQLKDNRLGLPWPMTAWPKLKAFAPELVHIHTPGTIGFMGLVWAKFHKIPCIFTHHTLFDEYLTYFPLPASLAKLVILAWMRLFWNNSNLVIAPGSKVLSRLQEQKCRTSTLFLPTGVDNNFNEDGDEDAVNSAENGRGEASKDDTLFQRELNLEVKPFLYVGRTAYEKSIDFLIEAYRLFFDNCRNGATALPIGCNIPHFAIVGDGPARVDLEKQVEALGLQDYIHFLGWRKREQLKGYYRSALAFLFASQTETQGLVIMEAELNDLPVIAVKASGVNDAVPPNYNLTVNPADLGQFVKNMEYLAGHPEAAQNLGHTAATFVRNNFSTQAILAKYEEAAQALVSAASTSN